LEQSQTLFFAWRCGAQQKKKLQKSPAFQNMPLTMFLLEFFAQNAGLMFDRQTGFTSFAVGKNGTADMYRFLTETTAACG
jgi:hypothetical protein